MLFIFRRVRIRLIVSPTFQQQKMPRFSYCRSLDFVGLYKSRQYFHHNKSQILYIFQYRNWDLRPTFRPYLYRCSKCVRHLQDLAWRNHLKKAVNFRIIVRYSIPNSNFLFLQERRIPITALTRVSTRGAHLILGSQRRTFIRGSRSLNISKRLQNTFNLSL